MRTLILCLIASSALAALAFADEQRKTDRKGDLKNVPAGTKMFDFKSASVVHTGRPDTYRHRVSSWNAGSFSAVRLELATTRRGGPAYYVQKRPGKKAAVYNFHTNRRVAGAKFKKHSRKSFSFTFNTGFEDYPPVYRWRWMIVTARSGTIDRLPNKGFVAHDVSTGHD